MSERKTMSEWFVLVDAETGERTIQQGLGSTDRGAVGPYATKAQAAEWAGACPNCDGKGKEWHVNGGPHGVGRMGRCHACKGEEKVTEAKYRWRHRTEACPACGNTTAEPRCGWCA